MDYSTEQEFRKLWRALKCKANCNSIGADGWSLTGNSGTNTTDNFLGTTDNVGLKLKTNSTDRLTFDGSGVFSLAGTGTSFVTSTSSLVIGTGSTLTINGGGATTLTSTGNLKVRSTYPSSANFTMRKSATRELGVYNTLGGNLLASSLSWVESGQNLCSVGIEMTEDLTTVAHAYIIVAKSAVNPTTENVTVWVERDGWHFKDDMVDVVSFDLSGVITAANIVLTALPSYVNDAAADADTGLASGGFYKLNAGRAIYQKP